MREVDARTRRVRSVVGAVTGRRPKSRGVISGELSQQRRVVTVETCLADYRKVRKAHDGTVNDVILATVTGGLRSWLMTRAESMGGIRQVRAVVPVSVIDEELEATSLGSQIAAHFVDLPIGEASPVVRLHQVSYSFQAHKETGRSVAANRLAGVAGFAPTTFHAIGSRVAADELRRGYQLSVTNVPGPAGAALRRGRGDARELSGRPAGARSSAGHQRHVLQRRRLLRHHRRPRPGPRRRPARHLPARGSRRAARGVVRRPAARAARSSYDVRPGPSAKG